MLKIGLIDLDSSHPVSWLPKINAYGDMSVVAAWDSGVVNPRHYAEEFAQKHGLTLTDTVEAMVPLVDAAVITGVDWDTHVDRAAPFIEVGKPVMIDKPIAGKLRDLDRLKALHLKHPDVLIMGGSSLRFCYEMAALRHQRAELGQISCAFASGPNDFFSYGIHTVELFQGFFGPGVRSVRALGAHSGGELFQATYQDGPIVTYQLHAPASEWFFCASTSQGTKSLTVDNSKLYDALIEWFHAMLTERTLPNPLDDSLESIKVQLAALKARQTGLTVYLDDLAYDEGFDGAAYAASYRIQKWKGAY
ncbi:MAG: Gfo/Idh/MocA family oxidoreductase [Candidatus Latescibacteria bacterium]|nr:Gfo/Idh/MocA family oxidoreductase [Candidatus Latescibacterota bacterium]